jgi:hypothetical protein
LKHCEINICRFAITTQQALRTQRLSIEQAATIERMRPSSS